MLFSSRVVQSSQAVARRAARSFTTNGAKINNNSQRLALGMTTAATAAATAGYIYYNTFQENNGMVRILFLHKITHTCF